MLRPNVRSGSTLCENSDAQLACRTSISISVDAGVNYTDNFFRKKAIEKTILRILWPIAFSHSLGQTRKSARFTGMSVLPSTADVVGPPRHVRKVPRRDSCGVAKQQPYSITRSALLSSEGGTVRSRAFAVLRLITSSNFSGASTGSSLGFAPLKMRSA